MDDLNKVKEKSEDESLELKEPELHSTNDDESSASSLQKREGEDVKVNSSVEGSPLRYPQVKEKKEKLEAERCPTKHTVFRIPMNVVVS